MMVQTHVFVTHPEHFWTHENDDARDKVQKQIDFVLCNLEAFAFSICNIDTNSDYWPILCKAAGTTVDRIHPNAPRRSLKVWKPCSSYMARSTENRIQDQLPKHFNINDLQEACKQVCIEVQPPK